MTKLVDFRGSNRFVKVGLKQVKLNFYGANDIKHRSEIMYVFHMPRFNRDVQKCSVQFTTGSKK